MSPPTAGAAAVYALFYPVLVGSGRARERVALGQAERRVDVAFGRNPVAPELPPAAALAQGEHAPPDGKLPVRGEGPGDIHT